MIRIVPINLGIMAVLLIALELVFGTWFSGGHALYQFTQMRNRVIVRDNPLPGGGDTITYTRDEYGFRGLQGPVSDIDLVTVGGTTTDQRWIDDSETFQTALGGMFDAAGQRVSIVNAGIDGQSSFGHIQNFPSWFSRIPGLHPTYILYYVGINDILKMSSMDMYDTVARDSTWSLIKGFMQRAFDLLPALSCRQGRVGGKADPPRTGTDLNRRHPAVCRQPGDRRSFDSGDGPVAGGASRAHRRAGRADRGVRRQGHFRDTAQRPVGPG